MREMTLRELQLFSVEILKDVHCFCQNNGLCYSMFDGSLIGIIRHKGYIPWDDDIDIVLPRPDFDRLIRTYKSDNFKLKYYETDHNCMIAFARIYDDKRTTTTDTLPWCRDEVGVWIDVFPADGTYTDVSQHRKHYAQAFSLRKQTLKGRYGLSPLSWKRTFIQNYHTLERRIRYLNGRLVGPLIRRMIAFGRKVPYGSTPYWTQMTCFEDNSKEHNRVEWFDNCIALPFEDTEAMVMGGYEEFLRQKYNDYMQLPPVEKRVPHSTTTHFYWKN